MGNTSIEDSGDTSSDDILSRTIFHLRDVTQTEYTIALIIACMSLALMPPVIFLLPLFFVARRIWMHGRVPAAVVQKIKSLAPFPRRTYVRASRSTQCSLFRVPLITVLSVPRRYFERIESDEFRASVLHEYGHTKQYDLAVLVWLLGSSFVWLNVLRRDLPAIATGNFARYLEYENADILYKTGLFWALTVLLIMTACVVASVSILHRREYLADALGEQLGRGAVLGLLTRLDRRAAHSKPKGLVTRISNIITHPSYTKRLSNLKQGRHPTCWGSFVSALLVSFLATHASLMFQVTGATGMRMSGIDPLMVWIMLFLVLLYAVRKITSFAASNHTSYPMTAAAACGFAFGFLVSLVSVFTLDIVVFGVGADPIELATRAAAGIFCGLMAFSLSAAIYVRLRLPRYFYLQLVECAGYLYITSAMFVAPSFFDSASGGVGWNGVPFRSLLMLETVLLIVLIAFAALVVFASFIIAGGRRLAKKVAVHMDGQRQT